MLYKLSQGQKNIVDTALAFVGMLGGLFVSNASSLHYPWNLAAGIGGSAIGYFASDAITYVDSGQKPSAAQITQQVSSLWKLARPAAEAEIKKAIIDPAQQAIALSALDAAERQLLGSSQ